MCFGHNYMHINNLDWFDPVGSTVGLWLLRHRQTKEAETDRLIPNATRAFPLLYLFS